MLTTHRGIGDKIWGVFHDRETVYLSVTINRGVVKTFMKLAMMGTQNNLR